MEVDKRLEAEVKAHQISIIERLGGYMWTEDAQ